MDLAKLEEKAEVIKNYLKVCKGSIAYPPGFVLLTNKNLPIKHLVILIAVGKACAHALNISNPSLTPKECYTILKKQLRVSPFTVYYYLSKLADEGYSTRVKRGEYIFNMDKLDDFLEELKLYEGVC